MVNEGTQNEVLVPGRKEPEHTPFGAVHLDCGDDTQRRAEVEDRPQESLAQRSRRESLKSEKEQNQVRTPLQKRRPGFPTVYGFAES